MKYYTIQNNGLLIAENKQTLTKFYNNVLPLPEDYEKGKYITENNKLVFNTNWEQEQAQKEKQKQIDLITEKMELIDKKRIRAICEDEPKDEDTTWLEYYNSIIRNLREQLGELLK